MTARLTVWYDGACPLCIREIALMRRLDKRQRIAFEDVTEPSTGCPLDRSLMLARKPGTAVYASLLEKAEIVGASYIVMGAYGHSPTVEAIFGGVTRSMLTNTKLPLLLAH